MAEGATQHSGFGLVAALIPGQVPVFPLPELVAVYRVLEEKSEIREELKVIPDEISLVAQEGVVAQAFLQGHVPAVAGRLSPLGIVNSPKPADAAIAHRPLGNLARGIPATPEGR